MAAKLWNLVFLNTSNQLYISRGWFSVVEKHFGDRERWVWS